MTLQLGQPVPDGGQYVLDVFISNAGKPPCSIPQQPGVQLVNDDTAANPRASLDVAASGAGAATTASSPGSQLAVPGEGSVVATLTYPEGPEEGCDANGPWVPTRMVVTLGADLQVTAGWPGKAVDDCEGDATSPGVFISPFAVAK